MKISLERAKRLLDSNLSIITIGDNKIPNSNYNGSVSWKHYQSNPITKEQLESDYNQPNTKGFGIACGYGNVEVIDIDLKILSSLKEQQDFWNEYLQLLRDNINDFDDKFVIYKTVNNGYHILYRCEFIEGNKKIAKLKGYKEAIIESRGKGGYVFIYEKQVSKLTYTEIGEISIKDRETLLECSRFYNYIEEQPEDNKLKNESNVDVTTWDDYNKRTSIYDVIGNDFNIVRRLSDKTIIKRIGAKSAHSGYIYNDSGCMYLFSTGTIYPNEKLISPFTAYSYKNHNGNFKDAAKDLYKQGYGSRVIKEVKSLSKSIVVDKTKIDFPIDIFPVEIQNYMIQCNKTLDSSIDYMGCALLWAKSVIIGNTFKVQVKSGWIESVNIWIAIVGKAGLGKTPSINNIIFPLNKLNNREIKKYQSLKAKYEIYQDMTNEEKKNHEHVPNPSKTQFIVNDITLESLVDLHEDNKNAVGVFKDELAGWFKDMNKYRAGSDLEFWLSSWSNKGISMNRKTAKSSFVESPIIPVMGGVQPSILNQFYTEENKDNGFIDRMLCSFPDLDIEYYNTKEMPIEILQWYEDWLITSFKNIEKITKYNIDKEIEPKLCTLDKEAAIEWERIYNKITKIQNSDNENEYMKSMLPKQKSYVPRFALILHYIDGYQKGEISHSISKDSFLKAEKLSDYFINMAKKIKINSIESQDLKTIIKENKGKSNKELVNIILESNPELNKSIIAEALGISRQMVYKYKKQ